MPVLMHMERTGVLLDTKLLKEMSEQIGEQLKMLEGAIYGEARQGSISILHASSVKCCSRSCRCPRPRRRDSYSTSADVLEALRGDDPIIDHILDYRGLSKLKSTYMDALPALINPKTGSLHTSFNQTRTTTGRLSSSDPNLQNIPIRSEQGRQIREAFIAPPGSTLLAADYSQIDLRSLAHLSGDENLSNAFRKTKIFILRRRHSFSAWNLQCYDGHAAACQDGELRRDLRHERVRAGASHRAFP